MKRAIAHLAGVSAVAVAAGVASGQEYEVRIVEALSTFGIPESYLGDVNDSGVATGSMTYTTVLPGGSTSTTYKGFRWSEAGGPEVFTNTSSLSGINNPGDLIAGSQVMWAGGGTSSIPAIPGYPYVNSSEINDAGMVVGSSHWRSTSNASYDRAFYWTEAGGTVDLTAFVPHAQYAVDVNEGGQIVGATSNTGIRGDTEAFLYDSATGVFTDLHRLLNSAGSGITEATGINNHGVVVGEGTAGSFVAGWVWDPNAGFTFLPALKNGDRDRNRPYDINDEGLVVGTAATDGWADWRAYIWDEARGMHDLNDLVDLPTNFILDWAVGISNTGVIVGIGHWGPAWGPSVAYVLFPLEAPCYADCTGEGVLDIFDFVCFQDAFVAGDPYADCTGEGTLDIFDFVCFQDAFVAGCP